MHLLGPNVESQKHLSSLFKRLCLDQNSIPRTLMPYILPSTAIFELDPLSHYCINHPHLGDLLLYRVSMHVHPWGMNVVLCNKENQKAFIRDWTLCLHKKGWNMITYVHIGGGGLSPHMTKMKHLSFKYDMHL
jgi:hypothetical protein